MSVIWEELHRERDWERRKREADRKASLSFFKGLRTALVIAGPCWWLIGKLAGWWKL